jgi:hypothetical protein
VGLRLPVGLPGGPGTIRPRTDWPGCCVSPVGTAGTSDASARLGLARRRWPLWSALEFSCACGPLARTGEVLQDGSTADGPPRKTSRSPCCSTASSRRRLVAVPARRWRWSSWRVSEAICRAGCPAETRPSSQISLRCHPSGGGAGLTVPNRLSNLKNRHSTGNFCWPSEDCDWSMWSAVYCQYAENAASRALMV